METGLRVVSLIILVCLLFCSSVALPSRIIVSKVDFPRTPEPTNVHLDQAMNLNKMNILTGTPTNTRTVRLYNKNGFFLKIINTGKLRGTRSFHGRDTLIQMESMGPSIVRFKGVVSNSYLCMNDEGISHVLAKPTDECLFKEKLGANYFHTFASHKYSGKNPGNVTHEFYIAIKKNGKLKHGTNTAAIQKSVDFTVVPAKLK